MPGSGPTRQTHVATAATTAGTKLGLEQTTPLPSPLRPPSEIPPAHPPPLGLRKSWGTESETHHQGLDKLGPS